MDQAQQLRNVIKQRNQNYIEPARVITITSGKGGSLAQQTRKESNYF